MILPAAHYGRDGMVAIALVAQAMASGRVDLRALADALPRYRMVKDRTHGTGEPWERSEARLRAAFSGYEVNTADGLRFAREGAWVHVRPSGTEPIVRIIAESATDEETRDLVTRARDAIQSRA